MERRRFLKAASIVTAVGFTGVAGCTAPGGDGGDAGTEPPEETQTETPTATPTETPTNETRTTTTETGGAQQAATHYKFGGKVAGWQGREPQKIADAVNPTLNLEAGKTYKVTWENLDNAPHNFTIQGSNGNSLASTETMSNQGETLSLTFTASEDMATYICTIHPTTMVGDINFSSG